MSNNQNYLDPNSNFPGGAPPINSQPSVGAEKRLPEGMPSSSPTAAPGIIRNEGDGQYNYNSGYMNQTPSTTQPGYSQPPIGTNPPTYNQESPGMGVTNSSNQHPAMSPGMMGASNLSSNQPSIGQRNYQSYPQPGYNGSQPSGQGLNQNVGGMSGSGGMNQSYIPPGGPQPAVQPNIAPVSAPAPAAAVSSSLGEKTYEPVALHTPSATGEANYVEILGISPESQAEYDKKTPLCKQYKQTEVFAAIQVKNEEDGLKIINYLMKNGTSLTATDALDQTALFYASRDGKLKILNLLLENGCSANQRDTYGQTPIYYASRDNKIDICQRLIEAGADVNNEDMHNQT